MSIKVIPYDPEKDMALHHVALCPRDIDQSIRFYQEGIGLKRILDENLPGNWRHLFNARSDQLRTIFFGDPARPDAGILELVAFEGGHDEVEQPAAPVNGFFLISFLVDVPKTLERLARLGLDRDLKIDAPMGEDLNGHQEASDTSIALVRDPDGILVELIPISIVSE